jgi:hypothetical protein
LVVITVRSVPGFVCGLCVVLLVAGCGFGNGETASTVTTAPGLPIAAEAPSSFDPCTYIPRSVLDLEDLRPDGLDSNVDGGRGIRWRGCGYVAPDSYAVGITTTNLTLPVVRDNDDFVVREEYTVDGRAAMAVNSADDPDMRASCIFYVEMVGGSLELSIDNPSSRDKTGHLDTCGLALGLARKLAPLIPDA